MNKKQLVKKDSPVLLYLPYVLTVLTIGLFLFLPGSDLKGFREHSYSTVILDRNGYELRVVPLKEGLRREYSEYSAIPDEVRKVFIKSEDKRFLSHFGVDVSAFIRAIGQNLKSKEIVSGASTITMQLAQILNPHDGGIAGKLKEMLIALRYEANFSKEEIFAAWISSLPYGQNIEGISCASRKYFDCKPESLSVFQATLLAIIPRAPKYYNPEDNPAQLTERIFSNFGNSSLSLTRVQIAAVLNEANSNARDFEWPFFAPHFCNAVLKNIPEQNNESNQIKTSLDLDKQFLLEHILQRKVYSARNNRITNGAGLVLDPETREVLAYAGSVDYFSMENLGMNDGVQVKNQPGSTLKPFLYELAMEEGVTAASLLPDIPMQLGKGELYLPMNFNNRFNGPVRLRVALASSLNIPAVYMLQETGVKKFMERLSSLGFSSFQDGDDYYGLGIALGGVDVSLMELTNAYCSFADNGMYKTPVYFLTSEEQQGVKVMEDIPVSIIQDILTDPLGRLTGFGSFETAARNKQAMFKTGTSNQFNNIWALGVTPEITAGVWMGNFSGDTVIGKPGSSLPAQTVAEFLSELDLEEEFKLHNQLVAYEICPLSGKLINGNCPDSFIEYFQPEIVPKICNFHTGSGIVYPSEYAGWLEQSALTADMTKSGLGGLQILSPIQEARFYIDPYVNRESQQILVEVISGTDDTIELYFNKELISSAQYYVKAFFPLIEGTHIIEAVSGELMDQITFTVE